MKIGDRIRLIATCDALSVSNIENRNYAEIVSLDCPYGYAVTVKFDWAGAPLHTLKGKYPESRYYHLRKDTFIVLSEQKDLPGEPVLVCELCKERTPFIERCCIQCVTALIEKDKHGQETVGPETKLET